MVLPDHFIADPEDQDADEREHQIEADKPGKRDLDHGLGAGLVVAVAGEFGTEASQRMMTRPQEGVSAD
jgi:hypothetical protein